MKLKFKQSIAILNQVVNANDEMDFSDKEQAQSLIDAGYAVLVEVKKTEEVKKVEVIEKAETVKPKPKPKPRKPKATEGE